MNKDIKFRYGFQNHAPVLFTLANINSGDVYRMLMEEHGPVTYVHRFTGLKDKNGKDIYESDRIHMHSFYFDGGGEAEQERVGTIRFETYGLWFEPEEENEEGFYLCMAFGLHEESFEILPSND